MKLLWIIELTIGSQVMMMTAPQTVFDDEQPRKGIAVSRAAPARVTYKVIGMMKTKSGVT